MSSIEVIAIMSAIFIPTIAVFWWLVGRTNDVGVDVFTGVVRGHPIPIKHRWLILFLTWMSHQLSLVVLYLSVGFAVLRMAQSTNETDARTVGYVYAFILLAGAIATVVTGISAFVAYASALRQAEAD